LIKEKNIWVLVDHDRSEIAESAFGLINEARRVISEAGGAGSVTAVLMGTFEDDATASLKHGRADRIIHIKHDSLNRYHGELFAKVFFEVVEKNSVSCILLSQSENTSDFSARLAAMMNAALVTRAMDLRFNEHGKCIAVRPVSNGYLFEKVTINPDLIPVICFLPSVLSAVNDFEQGGDTVVEVIVPEINEDNLKAKVLSIIEAAPEDLAIDEADIIVAAGRGAGKGEDFNKIHDLAKVIGGTVGGTRPVIDLQLLPFERQIGQTGKTVTPGLIINCGISGANEYSAGMEKSKKVISINKDPRARIFRFSDLGVVGDLHEIIPLLIAKIKEMKKKNL
jgi:electron transfer flavoprotein alpha subunit